NPYVPPGDSTPTGSDPTGGYGPAGAQPAPGQQPYGGQQPPAPGYGAPSSGYSAQGYGEPAYAQAYGAPVARPKKSKTGRNIIIGVAAGAGLILICGGVWATTSLMSSGSYPYDVSPKDAAMYAHLDLEPDAAQKLAFKDLQKKLSDEFGDG